MKRSRKLLSALAVLSSIAFVQEASAWTVCSDTRVMTEDSIDYIRANYCKKDEGYEGGMRPQPPVDDFCLFFSDSCKNELRAKLWADVSRKGKASELEFQKSSRASEAAANLRVQLENDQEAQAIQVFDNMAAAAEATQWEGLDKVEQRAEGSSATNATVAMREREASDQRSAQLKQLIQAYEQSTGQKPPAAWGTLANRARTEAPISAEEFATVVQQYDNGVLAYQNAQLDNLEQRRVAIDQNLSAEEIRENLQSNRKAIQEKMVELLKEKCGDDLSDAKVDECKAKDPKLAEMLESARLEYERLAQAEEDMDKAINDNKKLMAMLHMSKDAFSTKYGVKGQQKLLDKVSGNMLGAMMTEIACRVKSDKNACDNVIGGKEINDFYINNKDINEYFKKTQGETKGETSEDK